MENKTKNDNTILEHMRPHCKIWLKFGSKPIMGAGRYKLLKTISRTHSLKETSKLLNLSYRACQEYIKRMEERVGTEIVHTERGGMNGGGSAELTDFGRALLKKFETIKFRVVCNDKR